MFKKILENFKNFVKIFKIVDNFEKIIENLEKFLENSKNSEILKNILNKKYKSISRHPNGGAPQCPPPHLGLWEVTCPPCPTARYAPDCIAKEITLSNPMAHICLRCIVREVCAVWSHCRQFHWCHCPQARSACDVARGIVLSHLDPIHTNALLATDPTESHTSLHFVRRSKSTRKHYCFPIQVEYTNTNTDLELSIIFVWYYNCHKYSKYSKNNNYSIQKVLKNLK